MQNKKCNSKVSTFTLYFRKSKVIFQSQYFEFILSKLKSVFPKL